jgi:hypothetical protein
MQVAHADRRLGEIGGNASVGKFGGKAGGAIHARFLPDNLRGLDGKEGRSRKIALTDDPNELGFGNGCSFGHKPNEVVGPGLVGSRKIE